MQVVGRLGSYISRGVSTVSGSVRGAVDIVLVEQKDGSFKSSPWYVRFGKSHGVLTTEERMISINVNGVEANFHMYMDHKGQAFFLREVEVEEGESSGDETDFLDKRHLKSRSCCFESDKPNYMDQVDMNTGNMLARTSSDGSVAGALVIGDNDLIAARSLDCAEIAADLLEVRWSTNLSGDRPPRKDRVQSQKRKSQRGIMDNSSNQLSLLDEARYLNVQEGFYSNPELEVPTRLNEANGISSSCSSTTVEVSLSKQKSEVITELSMSGDIVEDIEHDRKKKEAITERTVNDLEATTVLPEVTKNEEVTENPDVMMPEMMVSQTSQQSNCTHPGISKSIVADIEDQTALPKTQAINLDIRLYSAEEDGSTRATATSPDSSLDSQALEEKFLRVEEVSSSLTSRKFARDCVFGKTSRQPYPNPKEKDFIFSDLESQTADPEKLRVTSSPTVDLNNKVGGDEDMQQTKSLSGSLHSLSNAEDQHDLCHPSIHSQDLACNILKQPSFGKDDVKCLKPDDQLLPEESGSRDNNNLGDVKSTNIDPPLGVSSAQKPSPSGNWKLWPFPFRRRSSSEKVAVPAVDDKDNNASESSINKDADKNELKPKLLKKLIRAKTPTAEQLASLNLKEGKNTVNFTFSMGTVEDEQVDAQMFLWKWNSRIVISDVDGTITKSDVLGQVMPLVGVDWSQTGVTHLFSAIKENGYKLLFLSARSISQAYQTRQFLVNLKQDGKVLPDGPVVISPDGIFPSLYREVIRRTPHEFKIASLEDIKALFPPACNPFYAGFGNRDTDEISYLKVGIPRGKIFIINPKGEIVVNHRHDTKSYTSLHALVHGMFPPTDTYEQEDFNSWNYWKLPPPVLNN
ncbi:hypothetical protein K1719_025878 [Acacia pycnantha]|nr:hypothetical protein K1719_025878 [Acacia pycnantha]